MKRFITLFLVIAGMICIMGCSEKNESADKMYIELAQLTAEEEQIAALLGLDTKQRIFDFVLDDTVQTIQVNSYRLVDGEWKPVAAVRLFQIQKDELH